MSRRSPTKFDGFAVIDKPSGVTSHDVVSTVRKVLGERRVGHSGTLDPDATGVLIVGIGHGTRLLRFLSPLEKSYVGEIVLGTSTSTLDASGFVTGHFDMSHLTVDDVRKAAESFIGEFDQIPPMVSAVRVDGQRLYKMALNGAEVERAPRRVRVSRLEIRPTGESHVFEIDVTCTSGTYVRSLADDIGRLLGGGAHLRSLRRSTIGPFRVDSARPLESFGAADILAMSGLVAHLDAAVLGPVRREEIAHGKVLARDDLGVSGDGPWALYDEDKVLLGIYEAWRKDLVKPAIVLAAPSDAPVIADRAFSKAPANVEPNGRD